MGNLYIDDNRHVCLLMDSPMPTPGVFTLLNELAFSEGMKRGDSKSSPRKSKTGNAIDDDNIENSRILLELFDEKLKSKDFYPKVTPLFCS
jgi:hypothetical protein